MNIDQEIKSEDISFGGWGGGWKGGGGGGDSDQNKEINNRYLLIFCAHALYKISRS